MTKQTKIVVAVGAAMGVLLAAVLVVGILILNSVNTPTEEERVAACMAERGYPLDKPANETEGFTMEGLREASEACGLD
ncbi:hypothetical protein ASF87_16770 [Microbacterium sp. Leaf161]|uniref:hypothetical protein n=1 Tax=Microbacterium sp. Leaf161 TaxID=1736281 RepID=UPI0006F6F1EE|nr:hypothetical protein [Microbacterium sp. Leaf161]KQR43443.1 hypothetical protein ASF87_16770 [Microbacterium sp. Leaf161]